MARGWLPIALTVLTLSVGGARAAEIAFQYVDEWEHMGVQTARWQPVRLAPLSADGPSLAVDLPEGIRAGAIPLGAGEVKQLAVVVNPDREAPAVYLDLNGDNKIEESELIPGPEEGIWEASFTPPGQDGLRTYQLKLAAGGRMLMVKLRGCRAGMLPTKDKPCKTLLIDMNGDGAYTTEARDNICVDVNGDGKFGPAVERVPLRASVHFGGQEFALEVSPLGDVVTTELRDRAPGNLLPRVSVDSGTITGGTLTFLRDDGLAVRVGSINEPVEVPEGTYRLIGADVNVTGDDKMPYRFPFTGMGSKDKSVTVTAGKTTEAQLLTPITCNLTIDAALKPGEYTRATVNCVSAEGLPLGSAMKGTGSNAVIPAQMWLLAPDGTVLGFDDADYG